MKSVGFAAVGEYTRLLGDDNPFAMVEYEEDVAFYQENREAIAAQVAGLARFAVAAAAVDAQMTAAEATIAAAGANAPDFYAPFS